jgi:outer membrane biosynthesis protein TonB
LPAPGQNGARDIYKPAQAVAAGDTQYPFQTSAEGIVVFEVSVGERGEVKKTGVLVDVPPFTAAAEQSLKSWKFAPATQNGRAEDSQMLVAFAFRHAVYLANPPALNGVFPSKGSEGGRSDFIAPSILYATYAGYPASTVAYGAIVVQASVKADGSTGDVTVLRDLPGGFAAMAIEAAKQWRFQSALRDGQGVPSKVAIAFVYSSRALNPF